MFKEDVRQFASLPFFAIEAFVKVEEAVVETVEEKYVPHIQPPIQPLSWAEVCNDC